MNTAVFHFVSLSLTTFTFNEQYILNNCIIIVKVVRDECLSGYIHQNTIQNQNITVLKLKL